MEEEQSKKYTFDSILSNLNKIDNDSLDEKDFRKADLIFTHVKQFNRDFDLKLFLLFTENIKKFDVKIFMRMIFLDIFFDEKNNINKEYLEIFKHLIKSLPNNYNIFYEEIMKINDNDEVKKKYILKMIKIFQKIDEIKNDYKINNDLKVDKSFDPKYINISYINK